MPDFVHLHVHSHYSLLDGLPKVGELVNFAKKQGFKAIALTDYGALYGAIEFYKAARKAGIKPIIGFEAFMAHGSRLDLAPKPSEPDSHIVLLAENYEGYRNLMILSSRGALEGFTDKPRIDKELLREYHNGVIVLSGCLDGEIAQLITQGSMDRARAALEEYKTICGSDYFYLELQDHPERAGQMEANNALIELGRETGTPLVVTRDVHYLEKEDAPAQDILTCIKSGRTVDDQTRTRMTHIDRSLNSATDICSRFRHVEDALKNTVKIAERCNVEIPLGKWYFPPITIPVGKTSAQVLRENTEEGLKELSGEITPAMQERLDYELNIISTKGYDPYFLAVADYTKWARAHGIIATTRGSAAGSLVSYAIGITTVNPLDFKLPFERFLNPFRPSPPDIDMDFADNQRDEVIAYVTEKYGADKVAQIITFGTMAARGSVRDVGRALGFSYSFCDQVSKAIPFGSQGFLMTISKALQTTPELYALYNQNADVKRLLDLAQKIEGNARHTSVHAAGVVIAPTALTDFTPIQREVGGTRVTTQYDMYEVEEAGLLKMDFLGIRNLSILGNAVEIVQKTRDVAVDLQRIPWDDSQTYAMLSEGKTAGLFQLGGTGMTRYLMDLKPSNLFDIMAMLALFRPGPMESIPEFIRRKQDAKLITYLDPRMKEYLDMSYGVITYQDDVLLTAINIAGYAWEEADKLRKAMGIKSPEEMAAQKEKFIDGCIGNGLNSEKSHALWKLIEPFAAYGFNKAHAASYAVVAYQTAYMKARFPEEYMTAVLSAESGDIETVAQMVDECKHLGIDVLPPDVNESFELFAVVPHETSKANNALHPIRFGLGAIKNVGDHIAHVIIEERKARGAFESLEDLLRRIQDRDLNKKSLESLIKCGALDSFEYDRNVLLVNIENLLAFVRQTQEQKNSQQNSLFSGTRIDLASKVRLDPAENAIEAEKLIWEKELLGLYVTAHPFAYFQKAMKNVLTLIKDLSEQARKSWLVVGGVIDSTKKKITRNGQPMMFVNIQDTTGSLELLVFPRTYESTKDVWVEGKNVCVVGRTSEEEGDDKLFVEKAYTLTMENVISLGQQLGVNLGETSIRKYAPASLRSDLETGLQIILNKEDIKILAEQIKEVLKNFPGDIQVYLIVDGKKIKTSFKVQINSMIISELEKLVGKDNIIKS